MNFCDRPLSSVSSAEGQLHIDGTRRATFEDWTQGRALRSWGTNAGAKELPFQTWRHFKEAFAPELVHRAVQHSRVPIKRCLDPFGGSGTTALACQFLGIEPITIEVNPFLADLIQAKLTPYDADVLVREFGGIIRRSVNRIADSERSFDYLPATFVEPGVAGRWIFDQQVASRIATILSSIDDVSDENQRRLFRVLLSGILIEVSNVVVNGKGRRYRQGWQRRRRDPKSVDQLFYGAVQRAISEIHRFERRAHLSYEVHVGDCREVLREQPIECELSIFSPPYPNSFDYTDVYNIELWILGYLSDSPSNRALRGATLCSHVQINREFPKAPCGSPTLDRALSDLADRRASLWSRQIPPMIGGYFSDIMSVLDRLSNCVVRDGSVWMVVGDSRYAEIRIETAAIIAELALTAGWRVDALESCRSMRASAQQGGRFELTESLIILTRC